MSDAGAKRKVLRAMLESGKLAAAPGAWNALAARLVEEAGFPAVYTVREFEAAGVAAIHLEDQVSPKRCGHIQGKELVSCQEPAPQKISPKIVPISMKNQE